MALRCASATSIPGSSEPSRCMCSSAFGKPAINEEIAMSGICWSSISANSKPIDRASSHPPLHPPAQASPGPYEGNSARPCPQKWPSIPCRAYWAHSLLQNSRSTRYTERSTPKGGVHAAPCLGPIGQFGLRCDARARDCVVLGAGETAESPSRGRHHGAQCRLPHADLGGDPRLLER